MEEKISPDNVEMGVITAEDHQFRMFSREETQDWIDQLDPLLEEEALQ